MTGTRVSAVTAYTAQRECTAAATPSRGHRVRELVCSYRPVLAHRSYERPFTIQRVVYGLTLVAALGAAAPARACPLCKESASTGIDDGDDPLREARAYNRSIYLMLAVPYTIVGLAGFYCYRHLGRRPGAAPRQD